MRRITPEQKAQRTSVFDLMPHAEVYTHIQRSVQHYARHFPGMSVPDVAQDAALQLWVRHYDPSKSAIVSTIVRVAYSAVCNAANRAQRLARADAKALDNVLLTAAEEQEYPG
jgi:hypothetical protein